MNIKSVAKAQITFLYRTSAIAPPDSRTLLLGEESVETRGHRQGSREPCGPKVPAGSALLLLHHSSKLEIR